MVCPDLFTGRSNRVCHISYRTLKDAHAAKTVMSNFESEKDGTKGKLSMFLAILVNPVSDNLIIQLMRC